MTSKLRFKLLALALMLASFAAITWLDEPAYAMCSDAAYSGCMNVCSGRKTTCLSQAKERGSILLSIDCYLVFDSCTSNCARDCFGEVSPK